MNVLKSKLWCRLAITLLVIILALVGCVTVIIDPYFHYHTPLKKLSYTIDNQRYQNYGIVKNFEYNAIITGTSMTENFMATEADNLLDIKSVKVPFSGASYKEINDLLLKAFENNEKIDVVIRSLDGSKLFDDKDTLRYDYDMYPWYLYDDNIFNDVEYIFNKDILIEDSLKVLLNTARGEKTTIFDEYSNWNNNAIYSKEEVLKNYNRCKEEKFSMSFTEKDYIRLKENITQNVTSIAKENPNTTFYYFIPPYSICWWDECNRSGNLERQLEALRSMTELVLENDNTQLYSFFDEYDIICNLANYKDPMHYSGSINSKILFDMKNDVNRLTKDNYEAYWNKIEEFYKNYDYDKIFNDKN